MPVDICVWRITNLNIQTDRAKLPAQTPAVRYLTITVTAPRSGRRTERPSTNVALVLDRSGSMGGRKIAMARAAVAHAIRLLDDRDRLALVCYDDRIDTLLASTPASAEAKALAVRRLNALDARGSTDLCGGWLKGASEIAGAGRVLLLTDGLANQGERDPDALAATAAELRKAGISTSTFGLGADFDERLLTRIATEGGGHFYFIEQPAQIPDLLHSELGETLDIVARDARVVLSPATGDGATVEFTTLTSEPVRAQADGVHVCLGDLVSGQEVTIVVAVRWPAMPVGAGAAIDVRLTDTDHVLFGEPMRVDWQVVPPAEDATQPVNAAVLVAAATQLTEHGRADALEANRDGDFDLALKILTDTIKRVRELGAGIPEIELLIRELEDGDRKKFHVAMDALALKREHYRSMNVSHNRTAEGKARRRPDSP